MPTRAKICVRVGNTWVCEPQNKSGWEEEMWKEASALVRKYTKSQNGSAKHEKLTNAVYLILRQHESLAKFLFIVEAPQT